MKTSTARKGAVALLLSLFLMLGSLLAQSRKARHSSGSKEGAVDCSKVDDATLTANLNSAIAKKSVLEGQNIKAEAKNGVATLTGNVSSNSKKVIAGNVARSVECVKRVKNDLSITPPIQEPRYICCCDGECHYSSTPCPNCGKVKTCVENYKSAMREARERHGEQRRKALEAARKDFYECVHKEST